MKFYFIFVFILLFDNLIFGQASEGYALKQLTFQSCIESNPQWSPDGKKISFDSDLNGEAQVFLLDVDSMIYSKLPCENVLTVFAVWDPKNNYLVATEIQNNECRLVKFSFDTSKFKHLINRDLQSKDAHIHPTGNLIAFAGKSNTDSDWRLYTYDLKYDNLNNFTAASSDCNNPRWSSKGDFISFTTSEKTNPNKHYIEIIHWYGKTFAQITDSLLDLQYACWMPTSSKISYVGNNQDSSYLFVSQRDGRNREVIFKSDQTIGSPCWAPDGKSIVFTLKIKEDQQNIFQLLTD
jgi:Tol biopolymer transport system component